jgi:uncharacterized protein YbjT (DUF2867 family)
MIVVAGRTGSRGSRIVRGLRWQGRAVRVLARPTSNADPLRQAGAEIVLGDLREELSQRFGVRLTAVGEFVQSRPAP